MSVLTVEGIVKQGKIELPDDIVLPEDTKVYIIIPGVQVQQRARIASPRLVYPDQAADFTLNVVRETPDADV